MLSASLPPLLPNLTATLLPVSKIDQLCNSAIIAGLFIVTYVSLQILHKQFISINGPLFWLQDWVEEIILWEKVLMRTLIWMAGWQPIPLSVGFISYVFDLLTLRFKRFFPCILFLMPHIILLGVILARYPYSSEQLKTLPPLCSPFRLLNM
jgi:hypothetical protein